MTNTKVGSRSFRAAEPKSKAGHATRAPSPSTARSIGFWKRTGDGNPWLTLASRQATAIRTTRRFSSVGLMSRAAQNFRQRDLLRAMKVAAAAGKTVLEIRVDKTGAHIVVAGDEDKTKREGNTWDDL
jgi:hypothetical protein